MENENKKKRKAPIFWIIYISLTVLSLLAIGLLLNKLYGFLDVYEQTRPVHEADKIMEQMFRPENREKLKTYLTNKVDNSTESIDDVLDLFYASIENKELSYGRYYGHYTDEHPQYILSAGKDQVAYFSLKELSKADPDYDFMLWELESVTLAVQAKYSYAVTIPDTMTLYVNGEKVDSSLAKGHKDSDCTVGYSEYSGAGYYEEPEIKVVDRLGQEVKLVQDETTGAYYYLIHYAYAPSDTEVAFNGHKLTEQEIMESGIDSGVDFFMVKEVIKKYSEYQCLADAITYPTLVKYYVDFYVEEADCSWISRLGTECPAVYEAESRTFTSELVSDDTAKDELVAKVTEFLETYALFCTADKKVATLKPYFPDNSEYYEKISHLNNLWVQSHSNVSFQNHETKEYMGYGENLAYVHVYLEQKLKVRSTGTWKVYAIDLPVWMVKINDKWYVGGMDFDNFLLEQGDEQ